MLIRLLSDIHSEFDLDQGRGFCEQQDPTGVDVLVLAGDITVNHEETVFEVLSKKFKHILYVPGNHEYWHNHWQDTLMWASQLEIKYPNVKFLNNNIVNIDGRRFLGATLWTEEDQKNKHKEKFMNDFWMISGGASQFIYSENKKSEQFLRDNVEDGDIIITHHLPSYDAIVPRWQGNHLNCFFANNLDDILYSKKITWMWGHTHNSSYNVRLGNSVGYCNPRGYTPNGLNPEFDPKFIIDI